MPAFAEGFENVAVGAAPAQVGVAAENTTYDLVSIGGTGSAVGNSDHAIVGLRCLRGTGSHSLILSDIFPAVITTHKRRFYLKPISGTGLSPAPSANTAVAYARNELNDAFCFDVRVTTARTVQLRNSALIAQVTSTTALPIDVPSRLEVDAVNGTLTVRIYAGSAGTEAHHGSTATETITATYATTGMGRFVVGATTLSTWDYALDADAGDDATNPGSAAPVNALPTVNAGADQANVEPGATVTLTATATDTDGTISSYAWDQITGTPVTLAGTGATRTFTAPHTLAGSTLEFRVTATDNSGGTAQDTMYVMVLAATERAAKGGVEVPLKESRVGA